MLTRKRQSAEQKRREAQHKLRALVLEYEIILEKCPECHLMSDHSEDCKLGQQMAVLPTAEAHEFLRKAIQAHWS